MTTRAMGGSVRFEDALAARLGVMRPSRAQLDAFLQGHPPRLSPGIPELVKALQSQGKGVFLVSGGFRAVIHPIAESLGIPRGNVYANRILFDVRSRSCISPSQGCGGFPPPSLARSRVRTRLHPALKKPRPLPENNNTNTNSTKQKTGRDGRVRGIRP